MNKYEPDLRGTESLTNIPMPVLFTCPHGGRVEFSPHRVASNVSCRPRRIYNTKRF